ncbi:MAG: SDR family oxidoreductase [Hyphomicrobium sp.]|jgi:hypothetical protein
MPNPLYELAGIWISRRARPDPAALARAAGLSPAALVTGGSRGIGLALALRFAQAGTHTIVLVARDLTALERAARSITQKYSANVIVLPLDITSDEAPARIDAELARHTLYLDYLVNSAGIGLSGPYHSHSEQKIDELIALNMSALSRLMRWALPGMRARGRGGILNVASLGGFVPGPHQALYYASKAFVISLTEAVAHEIGGDGVRISVVAPGPVDTRFHEAMGADNALYRFLLPQRSAEMVARSAYRGLMLGRVVVVPGVFEAISAAALRIVPHTLTIPIIGTLLEQPDKPSRK